VSTAGAAIHQGKSKIEKKTVQIVSALPRNFPDRFIRFRRRQTIPE